MGGRSRTLQATIARLREGAPTAQCVEWAGYRDKLGYGYLTFDGGRKPAYRVVYSLLVGPIPDGFDVHHECRNPGCVNPAHLRAVSRVEHRRLRSDFRPHCKCGHPYTPENLREYRNPDGRLRRMCRTCERERSRERRTAA